MTVPPPACDRRETSGITTRVIVRYVRTEGGDEALRRVLERSGVPHTAAELEAEGSWFSYDDKVALFQAAAEVLGDEQVARHVGETVLRLQVAPSLVLLLRALGSPAQVLRNISATAAKFSSVCTMRTYDASSGGARVTYRLHDGLEPSAHDCGYNVGLLSQVSELFGLPPAVVVHESCQVRGAEECVYDVRWAQYSRLPWRRRRTRVSYLADQVRRLRERSDALQSTIADLVSTDDVDSLLQKIAGRAGAAVQAPQHLLAVRLGGVLRIHQHGLEEHRAAALAEDVLAGRAAPRDATLLIADVESARHHHGKLVAIFPTQATFFPEERQLLSSYASQAAAALDSAIALEEARSRGEAAVSQLELARSLTRTLTEQDVADVVAGSIPPVLGATGGWFCLVDAATQELVIAAVGGEPRAPNLPGPGHRVPLSVSPELEALTRADSPRQYTLPASDPLVLQVLDALAAEVVLAAPVAGPDGAAAFIFASLSEAWRARASEHALERLAGLADQAALALERVRLLEQLREQADLDALTGLPNMRLLERHADQALSLARRTGRRVGVIFLDLDNFKRINDTLGHPTGNDLLRQVAGKLRGAVRSSDIVARIGGDEYGILLHGISGAHDAERVAVKVLSLLASPMAADGHEVVVSPSLGIALFPDHGASFAEVLQASDAAMYRAKERGRNTYQLFAPDFARESGGLLEFEQDLRAALASDGLDLAYQPIFDVQSGAVSAVEALVRWRHPARGDVPAARIVEVAEQTGLMPALGRWVLHTACAQWQSWRSAGLPAVRLHVNVSASEFREPQLLDSVSEALATFEGDAGCLVLEVTESAALRDPDEAARLVDRLRGLGVRLALDDFGTGYSMLGRLQQLRFDQLKIERTFMAAVGDDPAGLQMISALIGVGRALGLQVVAEGVETAMQLDHVRRQGCDLCQGDLLGRPMPSQAIAEVLAKAPIA